jgi:hypothetical protein
MANNLTLTASPTFTTTSVPAAFGSALVLNGTSQYATPSGTTLSFSAGASFTIDARVKTSSSSAFQAVIALTNSTNANIVIGMATGNIYFNVRGYNSNANVVSSATYNDGAWHHVRLVVTGTTASLSVDGAVPSGMSVSGSYAPATGGTDRVLVGAYSNNGIATGFWSGQLDEVGVFTAALATSFTAPTTAWSNTASNIQNLWHLDSGNVSGSTVLDCAGATFAVSPTSGTTGQALAFTGTLTQWTTVAPVFTITGSGNAIGSQAVTTATASSGTFTGSTNGAQTVTDASNGATATFTVGAGGPTAGTLSSSAVTSSTATLSLATNSGGTSPYSNQLQYSANGSTGWTNVTGVSTPATASTNPAAGTTGSWAITGMTPSTAAYFRVVVTDNAAATANSNTLTVTTSAAPSLTITGPTYGTVSVASTTFTVTASASVGADTSLTLSDGGAGGSFSPSSPTVLSGQTTTTFTYTPTTAALRTLTVSGSGYTSGTKTYASLPGSGVTSRAFAAPYGPDYTGQTATLGWTVYDAATGAVLIPHTTGQTFEDGSASGVYSAAVPISSSWTPVVVWDAPAGTFPFVQAV